MRRAVAAALIALLSGCSWLFMHKPTDVVDPKTGPTCDDSTAMPVLDTLEVISDAVILLAIAASGNQGNQGSALDAPTIGGTIADAAVFGASAASGFHWKGVCTEQRAAFEIEARRQDEAETRRLGAALDLHDPSDNPGKTWSYWCGGRALVCTADHARCHGECAERQVAWCAVYKTRDGASEFSCSPDRDICNEHIEAFGARNGVHDWGECVEQIARLARPADAPRADLDAPAAAAPPRGFFCARSPTVAAASFCVREKNACETARGAAVSAVPDLEACTLTETAWCAEDRCMASSDACADQQAASGSAASCVETK